MASTVAGSILDLLGNTPLIRLNRIGAEFDCEILAKVEYFNPGGSIKDRVAVRMIRDAEAVGRIKPGDVLIEPTSGNTGIGLALAGAVLGYRVVIVMPMKMSHEKEVTLRALGAQIIRTPTGEPHDSPNSNFAIAKRLQALVPDSHILDQFCNPSNPQVHYESTAPEIWEATGGDLHYFVSGAGTGGTLTGCSRFFKERNPAIKVIGADPVGSTIGGGEDAPYYVEGIGYDFIPDVLNMAGVDEWVKVSDEESFAAASRLIRKEGLLIGGSCGTALVAALHAARQAKKNERVVVVLPDSIRNYFSRFLCDDWMRGHGFSPLAAAQHVDWNRLQHEV